MIAGSDTGCYSTRRAGPAFRWPNGARIGIVFNIAFEAWSPGTAPGIGPMGNVLKAGVFDTNAVSWAGYGIVRGVERLARIAERNRIRASVMVNGVLAERHPDRVRALVDAGHEIVAHSYGMDVIPVYLEEAAERANIARTTALIEQASGLRPEGWISPRATPSRISPRLLADAGYRWHGDCNDDDLPAVVDLGTGRSIVAIPLTMDINDLPHIIRYGQAPSGLVEQLQLALDHAIAADDHPFMLDVTAHAHVLGRPAGAWAWHRMMEIVRARDDLWIGTRAEIARHALALGREAWR